MLLTRNRFIVQQDTPSSYSGQTGLFTRVNPGEDALEFAAVASTSIPLKADLFDLGLAHWIQPGWAIGASPGSVIDVQRLYYGAIYLERSTSFTRIGVHVTAAGAGGTVARLGIYAAVFDGDGQLIPDVLTIDAGTVDVATTGEKSIVIAQTLAAGYHFLALSSDGAPSLVGGNAGSAVGPPITAFRSAINQNGGMVSFVVVADGAAAFPDPATAPTDREQPNSMNVHLRI